MSERRFCEASISFKMNLNDSLKNSTSRLRGAPPRPGPCGAYRRLYRRLRGTRLGELHLPDRAVGNHAVESATRFESRTVAPSRSTPSPVESRRLPTTGNVRFVDMDFGLGWCLARPLSRANADAQWDEHRPPIRCRRPRRTHGPQTAPGLLAWIDARERLRELVLAQGGGHRQQKVGGDDDGGGAHRAV